MTLILDLDIDVLNIHLHTENEVSRSRHSKVKDRTARREDMTDCIPTIAAFVCGNKIFNIGNVVVFCWHIIITQHQRSV